MPTFETAAKPKISSTGSSIWGSSHPNVRRREDITKGAISMNGEKVTELEFTVSAEHAIGGKFIIIRKGKKNYSLVKLQA